MNPTDSVPRVSITFTDESTWLTRYDNGQPILTYPVSVGDVANTFKDFGSRTGLLAPETLWWSANNGVTEMAVWLPPVKRTLAFAAGRKVHRLTLPPLGFVWVGRGAAYKIFAAPTRPTRANDRLFRAPLSNVGPGGKVCPGNVAFPKCSADTIYQAADLFWESHFNSDLSDGKLRGASNLFKALQALSTKRTFPTDRLLWCGTVKEIMEGEINE